MTRKAWATLLALTLAAALTGCWDRRELEDSAFVLAMGVDPAPAGEVEVTMMIAVPSKLAGGGAGGGGGGGGGGGAKPVVITRVRTPAFAEANTIANTYINRYVTLQHTKTVVINEELVRAGELPKLLDALARMPALRRTISVMVSRGNAGKLLEGAKPELEQAPNRYLELLAQTDQFTGMTPRGARVHELLTQMENPGGVPLLYVAGLREDKTEEAGQEEKGGEGGEGKESEGDEKTGAGESTPPGDARKLLPGEVPRRGGPNVDLVGALAYDSRRGILGELSGREVRVVNMVRGHFERAAVSFPDPRAPGARVSMELRRAAPPEIRPRWSGSRIAFDVLVPLEAQLLGVESRTDYTSADLLPVLEESVARNLADDARTLFTRSQSWRADVFHLGYKAARLFPTYPDWQAYRWDRAYPEVRADIRFKVRVRRFGNQLAPPQPRREGTPPGLTRAPVEVVR